MLSTEGFLSSKRKGLLQHAIENEVSSLAKLIFFEKLLTGQNKSNVPLSVLTGVRFKRVEFRENVWTLPRDKQNCP